MNKLTTYKFCKLYEMGSGISSKPEQAGHGTPFLSFSTVFNNYFIPDELPDFAATGDHDRQADENQDSKTEQQGVEVVGQQPQAAGDPGKIRNYQER